MPGFAALVPIFTSIASGVGADVGAIGSAITAVGSAVGAGLGAVGAAAGVTGAGVTAGTSMLAGGLILGSVASAATSIIGATTGTQAGEYTNAAGITNVATTVDPNSTSATNERVNQIGRAALISTSPQGVQGTEPSGRYRLLGNSSGLGN